MSFISLGLDGFPTHFFSLCRYVLVSVFLTPIWGTRIAFATAQISFFIFIQDRSALLTLPTAFSQHYWKSFGLFWTATTTARLHTCHCIEAHLYA